MTGFFILAGGFGRRAVPLSNCLPKPVFPLSGKPLILRIISQLNNFGVSEGFVNLHYLGDKIKNVVSKNNISFIQESKLSGSSVLKRISDISSDIIFVVNGDIFLDIPFDKMIGKLESSCADGILLVRNKDPNYSSLYCDGEKFKGVSASGSDGDYMFSGVSLFRRSLLKEFRDINFFDTFKRVNPDIRIVEYKNIWLDIGTPELYFNSDRKLREYLRVDSSNSVSSNVYISGSAEVKNSILWSGCKIEGYSVLKSCIVCENVKINKGNYFKKIITKEGVYDLKV